ncbi:PREDICTED: zinc finger BED domain-containing protein 1-like [Rhagoletis zephyria]|uniref:zinc finger BED domain-containing protein 1-like n=2 Tax=Rhagoletis TaxID=28609 RepID=UPI0008113F8C|nr:PREDICTED: zinc finger BED domain-containing protein 1-like [Rhagoletis zephyria]
MDKFITINGKGAKENAVECVCSSESEEERGGKKARIKISSVWKYFNKSDDKKLAKCVKCAREYKTSGNTTNLRDHLKRMHPNIEKDEDEFSTTSSSCRTSSRSVSSFFKRAIEYDSSSQRKADIDVALASLIGEGMQPFNLVEDTSFRNFVKVLDPRYVLPSKNTLKNVFVKNMYDEKKIKLQEHLNAVEHVAITTDLWTSAANEAFITLTCHFIEESFVLKNAVLQTKKLNDVLNHNAQNIANTVSDVLKKWNIFNKVICIVTDNAKSMLNACDILKIAHLPCVAHTLNLAVHDALMLKAEDGYLKPIITKCKNIVHFFKCSSIATEKLKEAQNTPTPLKLIQDMPTRWNSTYNMLERLLTLHDAAAIVLLAIGKAPPPLSADEKNCVREIENLLRPFNEATKTCCGNNVTLSLIIPIVYGLYQRMYEIKCQIETIEAITLCENLIEGLRKRMFQYETRTAPRLGSLLDPRFKREGFISSSNAEQATIRLDNEVMSLLENEPPSSTNNAPPKSVSLFAFIEKKNAEKIKSKKADAIILRRQYLERENTAEDSNPLDFWKVN